MSTTTSSQSESVGRLDQALGPIRRKWSLTGIVGVATLAVVWSLLSLRSAVHKIDSNQAQLQERYAFLANASHIRTQFAVAKSTVDTVRQRHDRETPPESNRVDEVSFLKWLARVNRNWGVSLNDFHPGSTVDYGDYQGSSLQFVGSGEFGSICRVISDLREYPGLIRVTALELLPTDLERNTFTIHVRIELLASKLPDSTDGTGAVDRSQAL